MLFEGSFHDVHIQNKEKDRRKPHHYIHTCFLETKQKAQIKFPRGYSHVKVYTGCDVLQVQGFLNMGFHFELKGIL